jgi:hypothetical protein
MSNKKPPFVGRLKDQLRDRFLMGRGASLDESGLYSIPVDRAVS